MSKRRMVMKFEDIPNEILIECFEYFHSVDLFYSFDQLNYRFNQLIRTLPLRINFHDIDKSAYDAFCEQLLFNRDVQKRVYSLRLSNENTPGQIEDFLSRFSLDQFTYLQSLTLIDVKENNVQALKQIFPSLSSQITTLHILNAKVKLDTLESLLPIHNLQALSFNSNMAFVQQAIPIKSLTLSNASLNDICRLFQFTPMLQYLNVSHIRWGELSSKYESYSGPADLKELIVGEYSSSPDGLTRFLRNLSSLRNFTFHSSLLRNILDASFWEQLIKSSLPHLKNFRLKIVGGYPFDRDAARKIIDRFRSPFWISEHQWYVECVVNTQSMMIFTVPYLTKHNQSSQDVNKLVVNLNYIWQDGYYYFRNITSLIICSTSEVSSSYGETYIIDCLTKIMSFSQLKHLELSWDCPTRSPKLLFQILDLAPQLSSLNLSSYLIKPLHAQYESRRYLNNKIRKLTIIDNTIFTCEKTFKIRWLNHLVPNVEQLTMSTANINDLYFILDHFPKLSSFTVRKIQGDIRQNLRMFRTRVLEQNALFHSGELQFLSISDRSVSIWIQ